MERDSGVSQHIIIYCVEGRGFAIPAGVPHKYAANEKDPWTIYWIHFKGDIAGYIVELILQHSKNYKPDLIYNENRIKLFEEIYSNLEKGYSGDNLRYVNMILYHFLSSISMKRNLIM